MRLSDWLFSTRCDNCNHMLINQKVYTVREETPTGICNALSSDEPKLYDAVDCPRCGRQKVLGRRYRLCDMWGDKNDT